MRIDERPSSVNEVDSFPPRGSREAADNFCLIVRKHDEARGSLDVRQTIFDVFAIEKTV